MTRDTSLLAKAWPLLRPVGLLVSIPLAFVLLAAAYFIGMAVWRMTALHVLRIDTNQHIPRPKHKTKWWLLPL